MIDSTIVRAHQQAASGAKRVPRTRLCGEAEVGLSIKIHLLTDGFELPLAFRLSRGRAFEQP